MRLEPFLRAHAYMNVEQPPELWEADTEDSLFLPLLGEVIGAALSQSGRLEELTLNASNIVVQPPEEDEEVESPPLPGKYVAITVSGPTSLGSDATWHPSATHCGELLSRLRHGLESAGARFAYVRRLPPGGSVTIFFAALT